MPRNFLLILLLLTSCTAPKTNDMPVTFDWQGHRGARGLAPENSIPAFLKALEYPAIQTLELDVAVSADSQLVISHEPWFSAAISSHPDGRPVSEAEAESLNLHRMSYTEIERYDCGLRGHPRFPEQQKQAASKPLFSAMVAAVETYCQNNRRPLPRYNIEIKSQPEWDGLYTPSPEVFAQLVLAEVNKLGIRERSSIQSFDKRALQATHRLDPTIVTALLIEDLGSVAEQLAELGYTPHTYSPHYKMVTAHLVQTVHQANMRIIPWTVNETSTMQSLMELGVDGIITDYPDRVVR